MEFRKVATMDQTKPVPAWNKYLKIGGILLAIISAIGAAVWNVDIKGELCRDVSFTDSVK